MRAKRSKLGMSLVFHGIFNNYFFQHWDIIGLLQYSNANNIPTKYLNTNNIPISKSETFQTWDVIGTVDHGKEDPSTDISDMTGKSAKIKIITAFNVCDLQMLNMKNHLIPLK